MYHLVEKRKLWFGISLLLILPGIIYMAWSGVTKGQLLPLSIDYTGGTLWEIRFEQAMQPAAVREVFVEAGFGDTTVFLVGNEQSVQIKFKPVDAAQKEQLKAALNDAFGAFEELSYRSLGPTIGAEVSQAALIAVLVASLLIMLYIAWAFRQVPHPFRYGTAAVVALVHDVLVLFSFLAIMNLIAGWEVDALTLTAILTVIGFSVNDTVVVFDRIRENLRRHRGESFSTVANRSLIETATRSIATVLTALIVLTAILVLGGPSLRQFVAALIVGFASGMYSSLFNATPILAAWEEKSVFHKDSQSSTGTQSPATA